MLWWALGKHIIYSQTGMAQEFRCKTELRRKQSGWKMVVGTWLESVFGNMPSLFTWEFQMGFEVDGPHDLGAATIHILLRTILSLASNQTPLQSLTFSLQTMESTRL